MSRRDREKWDKRYRDGAYAARTHPSALLEEWMPKLVTDTAVPRAIDLACGLGRNSLYLARQGWRVIAVDISTVALESLAAQASAEELPIDCVQMDLENGQPWPKLIGAGSLSDLAIMMRYTNLPLIERLRDLLKPGGYLLAEAHRITDADVAGPRGKRFRVAPGQLRAAANGYELIDYREGIVKDPDGRRSDLAQMLVRRPMTPAAG